MSVSIVEEANKKLIRFDKPVQLVEIRDEEALKLASGLLGGTPSLTVSSQLRALKSQGYFENSRSLSEIRQQLARKGTFSTPSALSTLLARMVSRGELERLGASRAFRYTDEEGRV